MASKDRLLHCSEVGCAHLVYLGESITGDRFDDEVQGRFCLDCAHAHGYYSKDDVALLEELLIDAGLYARPGKKLKVIKVVKHRPPKLSPGQLSF